MTMTVDSAIAEREWRKYEAWSEYVELGELIGMESVSYFEWLDAMGLD